MNTHYDDRPPGHAKTAGYWVDRAWQDVLNEQRWTAKAKQVERHFDFSQPKQVHHHYGPNEVCSICQARSPSLNGKCSRCYHREYARAHYQKQKHKGADAQSHHGAVA